MIKHSHEQKSELRTGLGGTGKGEVNVKYLLSDADTYGKCRLCNLLTILPGASVGFHIHENDCEIYYLLEGELSVTDNGAEKTMLSGDIMFTYLGESHSVINKSDKNAKLLAVVIN